MTWSPLTSEARAEPVGRGCVGVELGGTSGYRVGRGRCYRPRAVERLSVEPALPPRVPLHCTTSRCVHALRKSSSGQRQWARQCLSMDTAGLPDRAFIVPWKCTVDGLQLRECGCGLRMVLGLRWVAFGPRDGVSRVGFLGVRVGLAKAVRLWYAVGQLSRVCGGMLPGMCPSLA